MPTGFLAWESESQRWATKCWLNVPGPFYTGMTDTCWCGREEAPNNVLYGGEPEDYGEFVFRQPRDPTELALVMRAAEAEVYGGYACDGDQRWTSQLVREWWANIDQVVRWIEERRRDEYYLRDNAGQLRQGLADFQTYISTDLAHDLRRYLFRLQCGHEPSSSDALPELSGD
jgi:hypothetical protein